MKLKNKPILTIEDIIQVFKQGCKHSSKFKTGMEYERILVNKNNYQAVPYYGEKGLYRLLRQIAFKDEWSYITEFGQVTGLKKNRNTITLEPGGQLELSIVPQKNLKDIKDEIEKIDNKILPIAQSLDIEFLNCGISPLSTKEKINLIPKNRYKIMDTQLAGKYHANMMRETAGIQTTIDFESEEDAIKKLRLSLILSPITTAMFANSTIYEGKPSGYKSYRALTWLYTDEKRCGFINKKLFDKKYEFGFKDYINTILDIPMLFIVRNHKIIEINQKITFKTFLEEGLEEYGATLDDFLLHSNIYFPETRLKNYIEIRNHDTQKGLLKYALPALYKGIFSDENVMDDCFRILENITYEDLELARKKVPAIGLRANLGEYKIIELAKEILNISYNSLKKYNEERFLEPIIELIEENKCPSDLIIQNWHSIWNANLENYIDYISET